MDAECGKDSAGGAARKGFRAERAERAERVGFVWSQRVVEVLAPGFRAEGVGLQFSKSGQGSFQQSALSRQSDKGQNMGDAPQRAVGAERRRIAVALDVGFVWRGGVVRAAAGRCRAWSVRLGGAVTRWSQIPIWDPSADDSDRYSFLNAERIPQGVRPGKDSGPSGSDLPYLLVEDWHRHGC